MSNKKLKIAAVGDLHFGVLHPQNYGNLFQELSQKADVLLLCGDLTQRGTVEDIALGVEQLSACTIPIFAVLGNHDYEAGQQEAIAAFLKQHRVQVLNGEATEINDVAIVGIKGFGGGFDAQMLSPFGETVVKEFAQEAIQEALLLEKALGTVSATEKKVVFMHYSPIRATVEGEHPDIIAFLGSSRLSDPIDRFGVNCVFHGHAHHGSLQGHTAGNVPVYNVALPLLSTQDGVPPYKIIDL